MSKSENANTNHLQQRRVVLALMAGGLAAGCGSSTSPWSIDPEGYDGLGEETFPLLADPCTINSVAGTMTLQVRGAETLYLTLRATDSMVIADGVTGTSTECAVPTTYKIAITENGAHPGVEKVFLDYINGPFALGSTTANVATPGITMVLGAGSSVVVRGSAAVDKMYLGSTYTASVLAHSWINVNGDTSPDVRMDGVTSVKVSTGIGADIISADGGNGTTGVSLDSTITFVAFGGPDNDTLTGGKGPSTLDGGDGNDLFLQTATLGADTIFGGKGVDTVDYSVRTTAVNVTICTTCVADPGGCIATDITCHTPVDTALTTCNATAATTLGTCNTTAGTALTTCTAATVTAQTACKTATTTGCFDVEAACELACPSGAGSAACITGCQTAQTTCNTACDTAQATAATACTTTNTASLATCTANNATSLATCTLTHTTGYATCDATMATCQAGAGVAACAVCTADDGAAAEGDTVNDDVEIVLGGKGNDTLSAIWAVCSDAATVPTVLCTLKGNDGDDTLIGSSHKDLLDGGNGNDTLQGGLGDDTLIGGAGLDTVSYADRTNPVKVSLDATKLWVALQNGESGENDSIAADIENLTGGAGNDFLRGNLNANIIHGGAGNDTIEGGLGNDSLYGEAGNDLLYGGAGNDFLVGGLGADTLVGGDGEDFIDAVDGPAAADTIDCDGVNDAAGTAGTSAGTTDALVKDSSDPSGTNCEL